MTWHYQVRQRKMDNGQQYCDIIEVYSECGHTENGMLPIGETKEEVVRVLEMMLHDAKHYPVFVEEETPCR